MNVTIAAATFPPTQLTELVRILQAQGNRVTVVTKSPALVSRLAGNDARVVLGDPDDTTALRAAVRGADTLVWRLPMPRKSSQLADLWHRSIDAAVESIVLEDVRRVIHVSHLGATRKTSSRFLDAITAAEQRIDEAALHCTHIRAGVLMDNLLLQVPTIRMTGSIYMPLHGSTPLPLTTQARVMAAVTLATTETNLGSRTIELVDRTLTGDQVADLVGGQLGKQIVHERLLAAPAQSFFESLGSSRAWARHYVANLVELDRGNLRRSPTADTSTPDSGALLEWCRRELAPRLTPAQTAH